MGNEVAVSEGIARVARVKKYLEGYQVWIYFAAILIGAVTGLVIPGSPSLEPTINPALAFMLFVTFLPLAFAVPGGVPVLPAVIVMQTVVELLSELIYIRVAPRFTAVALKDVGEVQP